MNLPRPVVARAPDARVGERRYAVILAGGAGTRLWPLSRSSMPKQLLALNGEQTLLQQTARRVLPRVAAERMVTVTHANYRFEVAGQLHAIAPEFASRVLAEPVGRNTLPAIGWAVASIARDEPEALIGVFSSDHAVADKAAFLDAWQAAEEAAEAGYLALFGMRPSEPATGYGYIQAGDVLADAGRGRALAVRRFVEKPDLATARSYLASGDYYWNGGMFVFRADVFLALLAALEPEIANGVALLAESGAPTAPMEAYRALPDLSIDYGLLEHARRIAVVPVEMGWSDLGSWESLYQQRARDASGNATQGEVISVDSRDNLLWRDQGALAVL